MEQTAAVTILLKRCSLRHPAGQLGFVDTYGTSFGRDLEPTSENGDYLYRLAAACLKLYRTGARSCAGSNNACCLGGLWRPPAHPPAHGPSPLLPLLPKSCCRRNKSQTSFGRCHTAFGRESVPAAARGRGGHLLVATCT